jgi:hypothetical protein
LDSSILFRFGKSCVAASSGDIRARISTTPFCFNHLRFLTRFGTRIAFHNGVNSEMNTGASASPGSMDGVILDGKSVRAMRFQMHELANVFTGVMIAAGLLSQYLEGGSLQPYAEDICQGCERGSAMLREARSLLLAACGEVPPGDLTLGTADSSNEIRQAGRQE